MTLRLFIDAVLKFVAGIIVVGAMIFLPAGSFYFTRGWLLMAILFIPMLIVGTIMIIKNPALLKSRLDAKESQKNQSIVIKLSGLMFIIGFVLSGLNFRFNWYTLPDYISYAAAGTFLLAYIIYAEVLRENVYLSRTIKVEEGQKIIDTGLYGIVRHPMYSATLLLFISIPIILGSLYALTVFLLYPFVIAARIKGEEKILENELSGYRKYKEKVKYRLVPFIW